VPAGDLFRNFPRLAQATTYDLYKDLFGEQLDTNQLHSVSDLLVQQQAEFD